ncbi:MAG: ams [Frankiales bacterium]|nr:ams [Frankiales bacterium]
MAVDPVLPASVEQEARAALAGEPEEHRVLVLARLRRWWPDLLAGLTEAYGDAGAQVAEHAAEVAVQGALDRPAELRLLDLERLVQPDWFQSPRMLGYSAYADRFGGDLRGVAERAPYLAELGVTYLHLLPLLQPRPEPNDGGYAVADYRSVRPDLGDLADLRALTATLRGHGISLALDLVLNHVAAEHAWARAARDGDLRARAYFHVFPDRTEPDAFERTLPEVFPDFAPGSFTWDDDLRGWVWTTFNSWQWDLDWHNPEVLLEFADLVCFLANQGVEVLRLDAVAFLWKRLSTTCQDQPEVHALTRALRAVARIAAPAVLFKAEAIVGPEQLAEYLGTGRNAGRVSDLAYHNSLMVQVWSTLAAKDTRLLRTALARFGGRPSTTSWATYLRCHDDIGWAVDDADAAAVGLSGPLHRAFLSDWYSGAFAGSDAEGLVFQENEATGDRRISGTAASLLGVHAAAGDPVRLDLALRRHVLAHLVVLGWGGLPVLWSGDELALPDDDAWADDPTTAGDNRWVHRPRLPWEVAARRDEPGTVEARVFGALQHAARVRGGLPALHASAETEVLDPGDDRLLATVRRTQDQVLVGLYEVGGASRTCPRSALPVEGPLVDALTGRRVEGDVVLGPYEAVWLVPALS